MSSSSRWSNNCLYCKKEDYLPYSNELLHYCRNCAQACDLCGLPKPIFAFPYDFNSEAFKEWQIRIKVGGKGFAPKKAHITTCDRCAMELQAEMRDRMDAEAKANYEKVLNDPLTKNAMDIMLRGSH